MIVLFFTCALFLFYVYIGYPVSLLFLSYFYKNRKADLASAKPKITVIIPAYNEEKCIKATVLNKLDSNYPKSLIEILVVSDSSTDSTDELVHEISIQDSRVQLIRQLEREGKTAGVNKAVELAQGEILVFADANSIYTKNTISELVSAFEDSSIGYVTGKMVYVDSSGSLIGGGTSAYMRYENIIRSLETIVGSVVGVDGGVDAMRRSLYVNLRSDQLPDFVQPLKCIEQGFKVAYKETAILEEESLTDQESEYGMRVRVALRAYWAMWDMRHLFNPFKYGLFSWQLLSHKLLRYLAIFFMCLLLLSNFMLLSEGATWSLLLGIQLIGYAIAAWGFKGSKPQFSLSHFAFYFCLINFAAGVAFIKFLQGKKIVTWKPRKGQ